MKKKIKELIHDKFLLGCQIHAIKYFVFLLERAAVLCKQVTTDCKRDVLCVQPQQRFWMLSSGIWRRVVNYTVLEVRTTFKRKQYGPPKLDHITVFPIPEYSSQ